MPRFGSSGSRCALLRGYSVSFHSRPGPQSFLPSVGARLAASLALALVLALAVALGRSAACRPRAPPSSFRRAFRGSCRAASVANTRRGSGWLPPQPRPIRSRLQRIRCETFMRSSYRLRHCRQWAARAYAVTAIRLRPVEFTSAVSARPSKRSPRPLSPGTRRTRVTATNALPLADPQLFPQGVEIGLPGATPSW
jgi:hypothetical protein